MVRINPERKIVIGAVMLIFTGFLTGVYYRRVDHILRTLWTMTFLVFLLWLPRVYPRAPGRLGGLLTPFYNEGIVAVLAIFLAVHVSLVNVPFTNIDLFNVALRDVDMISHSLGGLVLWLFLVSLLRGLFSGMPWRKVLLYSFVLLLIIGVGWEIAEWFGSHFTEGILKETIPNKVRDVLMEQLGALFGLWMVTKKGYPFSPPRE
ncbi:hypothetical protein [Thermococcus aciditolerans]|uniref:DUF2238 domain-containing protein n=1 Tax=Thermococcus aciditolerans TaxID=2598455 RepID=A0A5C0SLQ2_9EURY|nr:hypothetical protein [Thermococcus aciditolerans]QEK15240.1 hypothetical protein FPV09_09195 [Thermococcus aciditolerans]